MISQAANQGWVDFHSSDDGVKSPTFDWCNEVAKAPTHCRPIWKMQAIMEDAGNRMSFHFIITRVRQMRIVV